MKIAIIGILLILCSAVAYVVLKQPSEKFPPKHVVSDLPSKYARIANRKGSTYVIRNVSLIPMDRDTVLPNRSVLINHGRIEQITNDYSAIDQSAQPVVIEGEGQYLIPGLSDMHVHINDDNNLLLFLANGVTTIRNMAGADFHLDLREKIRNNQILGPALYTASPILEGSTRVWESSIPLRTKDEARNYVKIFKSAGYDFIKVYHTLPRDLYRQIMVTADSIGIRVVGHLPFEIELSEALSLNQYSIEHMEIRGVSPGIPLQTKEEMIGKSKKWMCPTLLVLKNIQKRANDVSIKRDYENYVDANTRAFWRQTLRNGKASNDYEVQKGMAWRIFYGGGRFITGTDCLNSYVLAGFSIHEELQELVNAGLGEFDALKATTVNPAEFLQRRDEGGTIETGKIADLVLLGGNPLEDISNTRNINGVFIRGVWFGSDELDKMLQEIRECY